MTMTTEENNIQKRMKQFTDERDAALLSLDKETIIAHMNKWKIPVPDDDLVFWIAIHKARVSLLTMPKEAIEESLNWLRERHYSTAIKIEKNSPYGRMPQ